MITMTRDTQKYFNLAADDFDAIYGGTNAVMRWINRHFRSDMYERFRLTFEACGDLTGKTVLDVGCGGGRYSVEFALRGAKRVVGVDFAPNMIELARRHAIERGVSEKCEFKVMDFFQLQNVEKFDICVAVGLFDYIEDAPAALRCLASLAKETCIATFPSRSLIRTPIRQVRYWWKRCPVYFYHRKSIARAANPLGGYSLIKIPGQGMDYVLVLEIEGTIQPNVPTTRS